MNSQSDNPSGPTGIVLNIQRYCSHDGPGIRTNVFLKGCSLRCKWCSNPERSHRKPELAYAPNLCVGKKECGLCLRPPFPEGAFYVVDAADDKVHVNWDLATDIRRGDGFALPDGCALIYGKRMTVDEVLEGGGKGTLHLSHFRRRYHPERRRVSATTGLCRSIA